MPYNLVNPYVEGKSINSKLSNAGEAAEAIWNKLSSNIKNFTPEFYFTIQDGGNNKLLHYKVTESQEGDRVKYLLEKFNANVNDKLEESFLEEIQQQGGKKKHKFDDSSSSTSTSSSSSGKYLKFPSNKNYVLTYYPTIYGVPNLLIPTFSTLFAPYGVKINFPLTYYDNIYVR